MIAFESPRPDFEDPPVVEVVLSVQFAAITAFGIPQFGVLWERYREAFPETEDKPPIAPALERFESPKPQPVSIEIVSEPSPPRVWFKNRLGTELIQVQRDRFIYNWKKADTDSPYPRYQYVRAAFEKHFRTFETFLQENELGSVAPNQCEVTYVNHLEPGKGWERTGQLGEIFEFWSGRHSDTFLREPEDARIQSRYRMVDTNGTPFGRLIVTIEPRIKTDDGSPMLRAVLTARGAPLEPNVHGVFGFFDIGREYVVRGFTSITTSKMHKIWRRTDARRVLDGTV